MYDAAKVGVDGDAADEPDSGEDGTGVAVDGVKNGACFFCHFEWGRMTITPEVRSVVWEKAAAQEGRVKAAMVAAMAAAAM